MSKKRKKKVKETPQETKELSEWQKRNQEYLKKKAEEEAALAEEKEKEKEARMGKKPEKPEESDKDEGNVDHEDESTPNESESDITESNSDINKSESVKENSEENVEVSEDIKEEKESKEEKPLDKKKEKKKKGEKKPSKEKPNKPKIPGVHIWRALTILVPSFFILLLSVYLLSPYATIKDIHVEGTVQTTAEDIRQAAAIQDSEYMLSLIVEKAKYEERIKSNDWVESAQMVYQFPTKFTIKVKEFDIVAYYVSGESHYPILSNGKLDSTAVSLVTLPESYMSVMFNDSDKIHTFISELSTISSEIKSAIQKVELVSSKTTSDLVRLTTTDSDEILVPLSEIGKKLPYYSKIKKKIKEPTVVDMEAGVYSYSVADKLIIEAEEKAKKEAVEAEIRQKEEEKKNLEEQKNKLEDEKKKLEEKINQNQTTQRSQRR